MISISVRDAVWFNGCLSVLLLMALRCYHTIMENTCDGYCVVWRICAVILLYVGGKTEAVCRWESEQKLQLQLICEFSVVMINFGCLTRQIFFHLESFVFLSDDFTS